RPLPHRQTDRLAVHEFRHPDIDALRKQRIIVDRSGKLGQIDPGEAVDEEDDMRIAYPQRDAVAQRTALHGHIEHVDFARKRNIQPVPAYGSKLDADLHGPGPAAFQQSSPSLQYEFCRPGFLEQKMRYAAGRVAAGGNLAAVDVEDTHRGMNPAGTRLFRWRLDGEQLVAADAYLRVANPDDVSPAKSAAIGSPVEYDEMIAQAVHLNKRSLGAR